MALADAVSSAVAHWALDEESGTRVDSLTGNDLTDNNTVGFAAGKFGNAADFEFANSEYLSRADNADLSTGDIDFMWRAWVKFESLTGQNMRIVCKINSAVTVFEYDLYYHTGEASILFDVYNGSSRVGRAKSSLGAPSTGVDYLIHAWHSATNNQVGIAVNADTAVVAATTGAPADTAAPFAIGALDGLANTFFDGLIDDVVLLKGYILDATERTEDYNSGTGVAFADWDAGGGGGLSIPIAAYHYMHQIKH